VQRSSVVFAILVGLGFMAISISRAQNQSVIEPVAVFAVWPAEKGKTPDTPLLDPIVLLNGKRFQKPPEYNYDKQKDSDAVYAKFDQKYYSRSRRYPLFIHGSAQGNVTVEEPTNITCVSQMASVKISQPLPEDHMRLAATSVVGLGIHQDRDRAVTDKDRSAFARVAAAVVKQKTGINLPPSRVKIEHLYSVSLSPNSANALIGSVTARHRSAIHHLLLLAVKGDQGYVSELSSYHVAKDLIDHTDDVDEDFVEHLDLDNDGIDELITMSHYYESWDYGIYQKRNGSWKVVYRGGGGGC
jgi:hypothetical protein